MKWSFSKYQGAGNDFIIFDNRTLKLNALSFQVISDLCNRRTGIGADGVILLNPSHDYDFEMRYYNADGKLGSMCGNGARCIVDFAKQLGIFENQCVFKASDGLHRAQWSNNEVVLEMANVSHLEKAGGFFFLDTGSPHYVKWVNDLDTMDVRQCGREIRYNERFEREGTNVNFISLKGDGLKLRTYERGVEDETLSCGTGAVASAIVANASGRLVSDDIIVHTLGGELRVTFNKKDIYSDVFLSGPYERIFDGEINIFD